MNIIFHTSNIDYPGYRSQPFQADRTKSCASGAAADYDKFTTNKPQFPADEASFAQILTKEVTSRLKSGVSPEKVNRIKQQVASGTYTPNARRIAEHMLGYRA